jgi:hypothetical protein
MAIPLYGQNKAGGILNNAIKNSGYREITVVTAADDSHTLSAADGGLIFISAALASGAVIKLPEATSENVGLEYNIVYGGTMAAASSIELPNAKDSVFAGVVHARRCGNAAGVTDSGSQVVNVTTIVTAVSDGEKALELDENDVSFGGGIGTDLTFKYVAENVVFVSGSINVNVADTAVDPVQSTSFTSTGY